MAAKRARTRAARGGIGGAPTPAASTPGLTWSAIAVGALCLIAVVSQTGATVQAQAVDAAAVVMGIAGALAAVVVALSAGFAWRAGRLTMSWTAFLAWALLSLALSGRVWSALVGEANYLVGFAALAAMTAIALFGSARAPEMHRFLALAAPWVIVIQIAVVSVQLAIGAQPAGTLPNSTYMGELVVLLLPWLLARDASHSLPRRWRLGIAIATVVVLGAAGSRVAAVVALIWLVVAVIGRSNLAVRTRVWVTAAVVVGVLGAGLVFARAELLGTAGLETLGERPAMWAVAVRSVAARPIVGHGPDGFLAGGAQVVTHAVASTASVVTFRPGASDPHNLTMWIAVSLGLVGLALFAWFSVEVALRWRTAFKRGSDVLPGVWGVSGAVAVFMTAPAAIEVLPMFALVLGVSLACPDERTEVAPRQGERAIGMAVLAFLGAVCLVWAANAATRFGLEEYGPEVSPGKAAGARSASALWAVDPHLAYLASLHLGYLSASDPDVAAQHSDLDSIRRASELDAHNPFFALEYARTLKFYRSSAAEVEKAFLAALERYPAYPLAHAEFAAFLAEQGRFAEASEHLRIAELVPDQDAARIGAIEAARRLINAAPPSSRIETRTP